MIRYLIRRVLWSIIVLLALLAIVFILFGPILRSQKGVSYASTFCGPRCTPERVAAAERFYGLSRPWYEQMQTYVVRIVRGPSDEDILRSCGNADPKTSDCDDTIGHFGSTFVRQRNIDHVLLEGFAVTLSLATLAAILWLTVGISSGLLSALRPGSLFDRFMTGFVLIGQAFPIPYIGLILLYVFSYRAGLFPLVGYEKLSLTNPWPWLQHLVLASFTLSLLFMAAYARLTRANMLTVLNEDYIRTARAKGASPRSVVLRHGLRNAMIPIITVFALDFALIFGNAVLTETTFGLPGLGREAVRAGVNLDVPMFSAITIVTGTAVVFANLVVDVFYALLDPRIKLS